MDAALDLQLKETYAAWNALSGLYDAWAKGRGLTGHALFTLCALYHGDGACTQGGICREWAMPKQTVHSILKGFEAAGYLRCGADPADRRAKRLSLTPAGRAYAGDILEELHALERSVLGRMDPGLRRSMVEGWSQFHRLLRREMGEGKP